MGVGMVVVKKWWVFLLFSLLLLTCIIILLLFNQKQSLAPIPVGILYSLTGPLAITEKPIADATLLAIDEINKKGGILGHLIKPYLVDGKSEATIFEQGARDLIEKNKVVAIFGTWLSPIRKKVKKVVEAHNTLLWYPANTEGLEESSNIVYTGGVPNQVVLPALWWMVNNIGKRFFLVGSPTIFSKSLHEIIKLRVAELGGTIVGENYIHDEKSIDTAIKQIVDSSPKIIIYTFIPEVFSPFFSKLRAAGVRPNKTHSLSFHIDEIDLKNIDISLMVGDFVAQTYFQAIYRQENKKFIEDFQRQYGASQAVNSDMESSYANVYLWKQACETAGSFDFSKVQEHLKRQAFNAPGSIMYLDINQYAWRNVYISKIKSNRQFNIIWSSDKQIKPLAYPPYKNKEYWDQFIQKTLQELESHA